MKKKMNLFKGKPLRNIAINNYWLYRLFAPIIFIYRLFRYYIVNDKVAIKKKYKKILGVNLNLKQPKKFTEKLQWLKLHDRKEWYPICADKMTVRDYITNKLGTDKYLIPLKYYTENYKDIIESNIQTPCVIKCSHDNNSHKILKDKKDVNWKELQNYYRARLNSISLFWSNREWVYKKIKKKWIIVEAFLKSSSEDYDLQEFKFHCFNKQLKIIDFYELDNQGKKARILKPDFEPYPENYSLGYERVNKKLHLPSEETKEEMLSIVNKLSQDFEYQIRIDIYHLDGKLYIGELTFFTGAGFGAIVPKEFDLELGNMLKLPID